MGWPVLSKAPSRSLLNAKGLAEPVEARVQNAEEPDRPTCPAKRCGAAE